MVGVDYVASAIERARKRAEAAAVTPDFRVGDVTRLGSLLDGRPFDLILDVGCYHGLSGPGRDRYAVGLAQAAAPGATFLLFGFVAVSPTWRLIGAPGVGTADVETRFAPWFTVEETSISGTGRGRTSWHRLRRRGGVSPRQRSSGAAAQATGATARA